MGCMWEAAGGEWWSQPLRESEGTLDPPLFAERALTDPDCHGEALSLDVGYDSAGCCCLHGGAVLCVTCEASLLTSVHLGRGDCRYSHRTSACRPLLHTRHTGGGKRPPNRWWE